MNYQVLLYYLYTPIEDPTELMKSQRKLCNELGLTGRIILAEEGINGTVEGTVEATGQYMEVMRQDPRFKEIKFKQSEGDGASFPKLSIKVRSEIVTTLLGEASPNPRKTTGKYLPADELHAWLHSDKEFYIVDMRNDYECEVGQFEGSTVLPMRFFRQLPEMIPHLEHLRNKTIVTVCTGGVRCEKASGYLLQEGFNDVYQLQDGIVSYMEKYPNEDFVGQLYVFDGRVTMGFNTDAPERTVIGRCEHCGNPTERFINCVNDDCHRHYLCCENCSGIHELFACQKICGGQVLQVA